MKKILLFLTILLPWFISSLFGIDKSFYQSLNLPFFAPKPIIFGIVWPILYILISISIYMIIRDYGIKENKEYRNILIINYICNQLYTVFFFKFHSLFLGFVDTVIVLISTLFLYYETKSLDKKSAKFLLPYLFWNVFAVILSVSIYFMNL